MKGIFKEKLSIDSEIKINVGFTISGRICRPCSCSCQFFSYFWFRHTTPVWNETSTESEREWRYLCVYMYVFVWKVLRHTASVLRSTRPLPCRDNDRIKWNEWKREDERKNVKEMREGGCNMEMLAVSRLLNSGTVSRLLSRLFSLTLRFFSLYFQCSFSPRSSLSLQTLPRYFFLP